MDKTIKNPGGPMQVTTEDSGKFEPSFITHEQETYPAQATYTNKIITPADSLITAAWENMPRGGSPGGGGSGFGERVNHLGSSISHLLSDWTHTLSVRASDTLDLISHTASDLTDAVTHADLPGMVDGTRRSIIRRPERNLAVAAGMGLALGLLLTRKRP